MADRVIDACVAVKWFLQEVDSAKAHAILQEANPESDRIHMLDVAVAEVMNAIWKARRRQQITDDEVEIFLSALDTLPVNIVPSYRLMPAAMDIALQYDRSIYDALFAALTRDLGIDGVTSDEPLFNAVRNAVPSIRLLRNL